ncbi:MAG TPA: AAA family ATPase, partial [bacterium]|nr:AAA family ATPase [bacterium]
MDFFASPEGEEEAARPLADRLRPSSLDDFVGQDHILGPGKLLRRLIEADCLEAAIFYGPPGSGKTSLMKYIAGATAYHPVTLSAVDSNVRQVKEVIVLARHRLSNSGQRTLFFIDEFHRFNRAQQEVLLPHVEEGAIGFVGLTTYNPFFALAPALLSRTHLFEFKKLPCESILLILERALTDRKRGLGSESLAVAPEALEYLAAHCEGDGRRALRALEVAFLTTPRRPGDPLAITPEVMMEALQKKTAPYDRDGDDHYDTISALIKSIRGSDPDAAVYWLAR